MKRIWVAAVLVLALASLVQARVYDGLDALPRSGVVPGVVIVKLKPDTEPRPMRAASDGVVTGLPILDQVAGDMRARRFDAVFPAEHTRARRAQAQTAGLVDLTRFYRLEFDVVRDPAQVAEAIARDPGVELAEVVTWHAVDQFIPNDPDFDDQWHHREGTQPTQDNDIDSPEAWEINTGDPDIVIAIFDSGVLWSHPDLKDQIWINPGEDLDGDGVVMDPDDMNGVDDDGNGYIDDLNGWDFVASGSNCASGQGEDCTVEDNDPNDFDGHGTATAGVAASATNNGYRGAGVAGGQYPLQRGCLIMPCRSGWHTQDDRGVVRTDYVGAGVNYAFNNGALVGNLSAGASESSVLSAALLNAFAGGFIFTKSAGNDNQSTPDDFDDFHSTIGVASTNASDVRSSFSDFGPWVDISAPGEGIWTTYGAGGQVGWASVQGTSFSAPMVAGCAALIYANNPAFSKAAVESTLYVTSDSIHHLNPGYEFFLGSGRVNIGNALQALPQAKFGGDIVLPPGASSRAPQADAATLAPDAPLIGHAPLTVQFTDQTPGTPTGWSWDFGDGGSSTDQSPEYTYNTPGVYDVRLDATHAGGEGRKRHQNAVVVQADTTSFVNGKNCPAPGKLVTVEIHLTNGLPLHSLELPLIYSGPADLVLLDSDPSTVFAGSRVEYFEELDAPLVGSSSKIIAFRMTADMGGGSPPLPPGSGLLMTLQFEMDDPITGDTLSTIRDSAVVNFYYHATTTNDIEYIPEWSVGGVEMLSYCRGDFDVNGAVNSSDIIQMVAHVFKGGPPSVDPWTMDVDLSGDVTSADIIFLVNFVFKGGPAPK